MLPRQKHPFLPKDPRSISVDSPDRTIQLRDEPLHKDILLRVLHPLPISLIFRRPSPQTMFYLRKDPPSIFSPCSHISCSSANLISGNNLGIPYRIHCKP